MTTYFTNWTYEPNLHIVGSITTDGTLGEWKTHNGFVDFDLQFLIDGVMAARLTTADTVVEYHSGIVAGHDLVMQTIFPFDGANFLSLTGPNASWVIHYCHTANCDIATVGSLRYGDSGGIPITLGTVPEPASAGLIALALILLAAWRRR